MDEQPMQLLVAELVPLLDLALVLVRLRLRLRLALL